MTDLTTEQKQECLRILKTVYNDFPKGAGNITRYQYGEAPMILSWLQTQEFWRQNDFNSMVENARRTRHEGAGNCQEHTRLAWYYFMLSTVLQEIRVEIVAGSTYDHCFLIVNRTEGNIENFETWNADCYVLDPWGFRFRDANVKYGFYAVEPQGQNFLVRMGGLVGQVGGEIAVYDRALNYDPVDELAQLFDNLQISNNWMDIDSWGTTTTNQPTGSQPTTQSQQ